MCINGEVGIWDNITTDLALKEHGRGTVLLLSYG